MKKLFSTLSLLAIFCVAVLAEKQVVALYVPGMECNNCKEKVNNVLAFEKGVRKLSYDVEKRTVTITFEDKKTNVETLQNSLVKYLNYKSEVLSLNGVENNGNHKGHDKDGKHEGCTEDHHKHEGCTEGHHNHEGCDKSAVKEDKKQCSSTCPSQNGQQVKEEKTQCPSTCPSKNPKSTTTSEK